MEEKGLVRCWFGRAGWGVRYLLPGLLLVSAVVVEAQVDPLFAPRELERQEGAGLPFGGAGEVEVVDGGAVLMKRLDRVVLVDEGGNGLAEEGELQAVLEGVVGRPLTEGGLDGMTDLIVDYYDEADRPVVDVFVPEQDLTDGELLIEVTMGRVGAVGMEKTDHFNDALLTKSVRLERGEELLGSRLQDQQDWLNRNPFRSAQLYASPGEGIAEADILYSFEERYPLRAYLGYENTGTPSVGRNRWYAGVNWGNGFGRDHLVSYQVTVGDAVSEFQAHSFLWEIPLHRHHHFLRFGGAWAEVSSSSMDGGILVEADGTTWVGSVAYGMQLPRWRGFGQEISFGMEYKTTDNFLVFGGVTPGGAVVDVVQARVDYVARKRTERDAMEFSAALVVSPGGLSSNNEDENFGAFRMGADADYVYGRVKGTWLRRLPDDWTLRVAGQAQWASGELLPIEQLALGGRDTVRGYDERIALADSGYHFSVEARTPTVELPAGMRAQFLGFVDHGIGWLEGGDDESFTGVGTGVRLQTGSFGEVRADVAWPLDGGDGPELHVGVLVSF